MKRARKPYGALYCPTAEIRELVAAATLEEQQALTRTVDSAVARARREKRMMLFSCNFRGYEMVLVAEPRRDPFLIMNDKLVAAAVAMGARVVEV